MQYFNLYSDKTNEVYIMNISSFHNPNGKIYEADNNDCEPGTTRKIIAVGMCLISLGALFFGHHSGSGILIMITKK
jgi:hypothetical protein